MQIDIIPGTVGLFGTCENSTWRDDFIDGAKSVGQFYFNPQKPNWKPEDAEIEAFHLKHDTTVVFAVLDSSYGIGSLAEIGFVVADILSSNIHRQAIIYVAPTVSSELAEKNPELAKVSNRTRALVLAHLKQITNYTIITTHSLQEAYEATFIG